MPRDEYKKTAIRMPTRVYEDLQDMSFINGLSINALMVQAVSKMVDLEKRKRHAENEFLKSQYESLLLSEKKSVN